MHIMLMYGFYRGFCVSIKILIYSCISCDSKWEDHEVLYESEQERVNLGKNVGEKYLPLS